MIKEIVILIMIMIIFFQHAYSQGLKMPTQQHWRRETTTENKTGLTKDYHHFGSFFPFKKEKTGSWILMMKLRDLRFLKFFTTNKKIFRVELAHGPWNWLSSRVCPSAINATKIATRVFVSLFEFENNPSLPCQIVFLKGISPLTLFFFAKMH